MLRVPRCKTLTLFLSLSLYMGAWAISTPHPVTAQSGEVFVYHQITDLTNQSGSVGMPILSRDGSTGAFADAPATGAPESPNRIYRIAFNGLGLEELDSYQPLCFCGSWVDINADGTAIISTDSMQLRLAGAAAPMLNTNSNEISSARLTAAGDQVVFQIARDLAITDTNEPLQRGVYIMNTDGTGLRQIAGPDQIAALMGVTPDQVTMLRLQNASLDISDDGSRVIFGSWAGPEQAAFAVNGDGSDLRVLRDHLLYVNSLALDPAGNLAAIDVTPTGAAINEISTLPWSGGTATPVLPGTIAGFDHAMQFSADGSALLISPNGLLVDLATGSAQLLAAPVTNAGGNQTAVITEGLPRATMNADADKFLYAMHTVKCADCANLSEQLATLEIGAADLGEAPEVTSASIDPATIANDGSSSIAASASVTTDAPTTWVGFSAIFPTGLVDTNVGWGLLLTDAGNGEYAAEGIVYQPIHLRENDIAPRTARISAEVETADGRRHAAAVDAGTLEVTAAAGARSG